MQHHAYDQTGKSVVCMEGALTLNHGKHGEVICVLEDCVNLLADTRSADDNCQEDIVMHGQCYTLDQGMMQYIYDWCCAACGWCGKEHCENRHMTGNEQQDIVNNRLCDHDDLQSYVEAY